VQEYARGIVPGRITKLGLGRDLAREPSVGRGWDHHQSIPHHQIDKVGPGEKIRPSMSENVRSLLAVSAIGDFRRINMQVMGENYYKKRSSSLFGRVIASVINV